MRRSITLGLVGLALTAVACGSGTSEATSGGAVLTSAGTDGGGGGGGAGGAAQGDGGSGGVPGAWCMPIPACDAPPPDPGPKGKWNSFFPPIGAPNHRGRDLFLNPDDKQWILAKFAYGLLDDDIQGELVDIYVQRDCAGAWEKLGTATTTEDDEHPTVEGVADTGGHIYFEIPPDEALGPGRHKVHLVVKGDLSSTDLFIEVIPKGAPVFVSDIDGTLTTTETEEFTALLSGDLPGVREGAADLFKILVSKGYHPFYMTARPEWLVDRSREFLDTYGFPNGVVHTTLSKSGALGGEAATYKTDELAMLAGKGVVPSFAFGNTKTDAQAYFNAKIGPEDHRVFLQFDDLVHDGLRIESYKDLLEQYEALPSLCP